MTGRGERCPHFTITGRPKQQRILPVEPNESEAYLISMTPQARRCPTGTVDSTPSPNSTTV